MRESVCLKKKPPYFMQWEAGIIIQASDGVRYGTLIHASIDDYTKVEMMEEAYEYQAQFRDDVNLAIKQGKLNVQQEDYGDIVSIAITEINDAT